MFTRKAATKQISAILLKKSAWLIIQIHVNHFVNTLVDPFSSVSDE